MTANDTFKIINDINEKSAEYVSALGELNLRIFERLAARQVDAMNLAVEHGVRLTKLATESKDYQDFFTGQIEASKDLSERVMSESKASLNLVDEARVEYQAWFKKGLDSVSADRLWNVPTV